MKVGGKACKELGDMKWQGLGKDMGKFFCMESPNKTYLCLCFNSHALDCGHNCYNILGDQ